MKFDAEREWNENKKLEIEGQKANETSRNIVETNESKKWSSEIKSKQQLDFHHKRQRREATKSLPKSFDARQKWPECAERIGIINDQGNCGCCWAIATAGMIQDRLCITQLQLGVQPKNDNSFQVSVLDILSCSGGASE